MNKADFNEFLQDAELNIETTGRNDKFSDDHHFPYEPTSYSVLKRLAESGYILQDDCLIDYGCGKGRVPFYMCHKVGCKAVGIEMMDEFLNLANDNLRKFEEAKKHAKLVGKISFVKSNAEEYEVPDDATCFFFFNPFSIEIMRKVLSKILDSYYANPRRMRLFFYYPQDEYVAFFMTVDEMQFVDEIDCQDLFEEKTKRNVVMVFEIF